MTTLAKSIFDHATALDRVAAESYRMTNYELAQWLEIEACYAANEQRPEDAWNLREAARRLREVSQ